MSEVLDAIEIKKNGGELDEATIRSVVNGYTAGTVPDYQMAALLMAIRLRGMTFDETLTLTSVMADSGERYSFPDCVDKHSTGGVGDKVTLTALPLVAACGVPVAKLSGRGLGITGGTIDKLESIPGWSSELSTATFADQVRSVGLVVGSAGELAPADKAIYALRDITGTVDSLPLIGSSIVSKKVATGAGHLLYDVKAGSGAFMKSVPEARELAELLVRLSDALGVTASAVITDMSSALGSAIGNALEVREAVAFLRGEAVATDLAEVAVDEAVMLLRLHGVRDAPEQVVHALTSGAGYDKFCQFVAAQGGDVDALHRLPISDQISEVTSPAAGFVHSFDALALARAALELGAGRQQKSDPLDHGVGVEVLVRVGDEVAAGQPVARIYGERALPVVSAFVAQALTVDEAPIAAPAHILDSVSLPDEEPACR